MLIRLSDESDMESLTLLFAKARAFMVQSGNTVQWRGNHPAPELLLRDMALQQSYVCVENGKIIGSFVLQFGDEPTYSVIEGKWKNTLPYATMHRVASDGSHKRLFDEMVAWSYSKIPNLRGDTHALNQPMQRAFLRNSFDYCGVIYVADGTPRFAYQKTD